MKKNYIARRRGTSVAAAALSFALVAPFAQPVVAPDLAGAALAAAADEFADDNRNALGDKNSDFNQNPTGEGWNPDPEISTGWRHVYWANGGQAGQTQPELQADGSYNIDAIASDQVQRLADLSAFAGPGKDVVSGRAMVATPRGGAQLTATYDGLEPLSHEIPVYFQWMDSDGAVSPVYSATTDNSFGAGRYAFAVPEWIDAKGKKHRFRTQYGQKYQVWVEPTNDPQTNNELVPLRQAPGMVPGAFGNGSGEALGEFPGQVGTNGNMQRTGVWMYERPYTQGQPSENYMKAAGPEYTLSDAKRPTNDPQNHKPQLIFDDLGPMRFPGVHYDKNYRRTISGTVWLENGNERQLFKGATGTANDPAEGYKVFATALTADGAQEYDQFIEGVQVFNRADETKQWVLDHPEYVAGTVYTEIGSDGNYTLRFPDDVFGSTTYNAAASDQFQDHLYMWVEDKKGTVVPGYSTFTQPVFQNPRYNLQWSPSLDPAINNAGRYSRLNNVNFAVVFANDAKINITNFDNTFNAARRGEVARAKLEGNMPTGATVEWRDARGNVLKQCKGIEVASDMKGCDEFKVPQDAADGSFYYVALTNGANDIALDSFIVVVERPQWEDTVHELTQDTVSLPNIGKQDYPQDKRVVVTQLKPKLDADGDVVRDSRGEPVLETVRVLDENEYTVGLDPKSVNLAFTPKFMPKSGERYRIDVYGGYELAWEKDENGDQILDQNNQPIPVLKDDGTQAFEEEFVDSATITYRGFDEAYEPEYGTHVYDFTKQTSFGKWTRMEFVPQFTDEHGNPVELKNVPLAPKGEAFTVDPAGLPQGWHDVQDRAKVNRNDPGSFSIDRGADRGGDGVGPTNRGIISFVPWDNNGQPNYEQVLRNNGPVVIPVTVKYADGTTDKVNATIVYRVDDTDVYDAAYGEVIVTPGETNVLSPTLTHEDGRTLDEIPGASYSIPTALPGNASEQQQAAWDEYQKALAQGFKVSVNPNTGELTVTGPPAADDKTVKTFNVPVTVTYGTGRGAVSEQASPATVLLDADRNGVPDVRDLTVFPPEQTVNEGQPIDDIAVVPGDPNATVEVKDLPGGLTYNPDTNKISGTPEVNDWTPGENQRPISIEITVTNEDGSTVTKTAVVNVTKDLTKDAIRVHAIPTLTVPVGKAIDPIPVRVTEIGNDAPADNAVVEVFWFDNELKPTDPFPGLSYNEQTGAIEGTPTEALERRGMVRATRGSQTDQTYFVLRAVGPSVQEGDQKDRIPADGQQTTIDDKVANPTEGMTGEVRDKDGNPIEGADVTVDPNTGEIKVTVPEGTEPGDATVVIKDKDGNPLNEDNPIQIEITTPTPGIDNGEGKVEVLEPGADEATKLDDKVTNPKDGLTGEVRDKDGNVIEGAEVTVDPDSGEITVKVPEDAKPGPATVQIKDGEDNVGGPIHVVIAEPTADPTSVDDSNVKEVDPTNDEQPTGIKVDNLDGDTRIQAKDEDDKVIPVIVDKDGNISVVPGTDVDGPITVTITDPDLPGGKTDIPVPVTGHSEGKDDNGSDNSIVPGSKVEEIQQGDSSTLDDTVSNPKDGLTGVVTDNDGNPIEGAEVTVDPETGEITVKVPEDAKPGPATVQIKDGEDNVGGPIHIVITEKPAETPAPSVTDGENPKDTVVADGDPKTIDDKVANPTEGMTGEVRDKDGNPIEGADVTVDPNTGEITVTVPEGTEPQDADVIIKDANGDPINQDNPIQIEITKPAPSIDNGKGKVEEIQQGDSSKLDDTVSNPKDGLTGEVRDNDGNVIEDAEVTVDPETGEITVTVPEDAKPGPATVQIKDGDDNVGGPIHIVITEKPAENTEPEGPVVVPVVTTVDDSEVTPVDPTNDEQLTGIVVKNKDEGTKVSAKDEDGKEIPARIDNNGNVRVTPGEDVDGPITVTIEDSDLPDGSVVVEVPVNGHEKDVNDNGIKVEVDKNGIKTVEPNGEEQATGIVVKNPSDKTTVTAVDEDGNEVEVRIDEDGNVVVKPQPGVDGPIKVTISDPDLPNGAVEFEVPVAGHEKNRDDNNSDTPADPSGTTVDASGKTSVKPTDEKQDTGVKVNNRDDDTDVTAVDEDGKTIPVEVDEDGNVHLTPGTDVDGPITVTITDPDLPNGKVEVEVPVDGHSKNVDDNAISVDKNGIVPVQPTDEEQTTGIVVKNPSDKTTVTAVDEDGKEIPARIDEDGNVVVTPGADVDGPITVTITDPNLPNGQVTAEVPVVGHDKNVDDNGSHNAAVTTPDVPADGNAHVVGRVDNPKKNGGYTGTLVDRSGKEIEGGKVEIDPETGEIKVSVPKGTDPREAFVAVKDKDGKRVTDKNGYDLRVNIVAPNYGDATSVKPGEKGQTKDPFAGQNVTATIADATVDGSEGADNWGFTIDGTSGVITGTAPTNEQLQGSFKEKFPNGTTSWDDFVKQFDGIANPSATGSITLTGVKDPLTGEAKFELVGQDGRSILDPSGDFDGDGVSNRAEIEGESDPFDADSTPKDATRPVPSPNPVPGNDGLTDEERKRCIATSVGFGLPLLALIPIGLATQTAIPGLTPVVEQYSQQIRLANARIQQELGVFNPEIALQVEVINKQLRQFGLDVATVGAGLALIAAGILSGTIIYDNCTPGGGSSVEDVQLKGSSGKTYAGSSEKEETKK